MTENTETKKRSVVEDFKDESNYLRGEIAEELVDDRDFFGKESIQLLKHHGTYQQDNRDERRNARKSGKGKAYSFMLRTAIPGGKLTSDQLLSEIDLCDELGNTTLRVTTRQALQLHGILKENLKETIKRINDVQLSTLAACGDVCRNVMCSPAPFDRPVYHDMQALSDEIAKVLAPKTSAYHELWLKDDESGEKELVGGGEPDHEPIYGKTYLPRKFKIAIAEPEENSADIYANDVGLLAISENDKIIGYNVLVGGGMGTTPNVDKCFPAIGQPMTFATPDKVVDVLVAIVKVQRDFGNREDRKNARMKYLIANWGLEKFKAKVEEYYGESLPEPSPIKVQEAKHLLGWYEQGDGKWFYGLYVENGRIKDEGDFRLKAALRKILTEIKPSIRLTPTQNIIFADLAEEDKAKLESILTSHGVPLSKDHSPMRRLAMACPALPYCGLALAESERAMPSMMDDLDTALKELGLGEEIFSVHITGCPNGCARPYNSDIGIVGRSPDKYTLFLGGHVLGNRLSFQFRDKVRTKDVIPTLKEILARFKEERQGEESFGDFCQRIGPEALGAEA
ncbi:NADPH-dependent assimilatory sulfite reductase hemoprotein subunit [Planctomycetales bacterium 10988]|nr:NADPH-dependent assimilatory sulfite reductase hemoprotein subunit [Planctomycetales bacterium 10988]